MLLASSIIAFPVPDESTKEVSNKLDMDFLRIPISNSVAFGPTLIKVIASDGVEFLVDKSVIKRISFFEKVVKHYDDASNCLKGVITKSFFQMACDSEIQEIPTPKVDGKTLSKVINFALLPTSKEWKTFKYV